MLLIAAAAIAVPTSNTAPFASAGVSVQAIATIRVISGVSLSFGAEQSGSDVPRPRRTIIIASDGQQQPARLIEFQ